MKTPVKSKKINSIAHLSQMKISEIASVLKYIHGAGGDSSFIDSIDNSKDFVLVHPQVAEALVASLKTAPSKPKAPKRTKPDLDRIPDGDVGKG